MTRSAEKKRAHRERNKRYRSKSSTKKKIKEYNARPDVSARNKAYWKKWREDNVERCQKNARRWRKKNRDHLQRTRRDQRLQKRYGITAVQWDQLLELQKGKCALCEKSLTNDISTHVDHDHKTGVVRGLLCSGCNLFEGRVAKLGIQKITEYWQRDPLKELGYV